MARVRERIPPPQNGHSHDFVTDPGHGVSGPLIRGCPGRFSGRRPLRSAYGDHPDLRTDPATRFGEIAARWPRIGLRSSTPAPHRTGTSPDRGPARAARGSLHFAVEPRVIHQRLEAPGPALSECQMSARAGWIARPMTSEKSPEHYPGSRTCPRKRSSSAACISAWVRIRETLAKHLWMGTNRHVLDPITRVLLPLPVAPRHFQIP